MLIAPDEGGNDVYVHVSELEKVGISSLSPGGAVDCNQGLPPRGGKIAGNLQRAELTALERDTQVARWIELSS
jgi:cold shock CspA family protein